MQQLKEKDSATVHANLKQIQDSLLETMPNLDKRSFTDDAFKVLRAFFAGMRQKKKMVSFCKFEEIFFSVFFFLSFFVFRVDWKWCYDNNDYLNSFMMMFFCFIFFFFMYFFFLFRLLFLFFLFLFLFTNQSIAWGQTLVDVVLDCLLGWGNWVWIFVYLCFVFFFLNLFHVFVFFFFFHRFVVWHCKIILQFTFHFNAHSHFIFIFNFCQK